MTLKRLLLQIRFWMYLGDGYKRGEYARKKGIFAKIGKDVSLPAEIPLYPKLVRVHNNVLMHRSVKLVTHDMINGMFLKKLPDGYQYKHPELLNPIEIMDNVYIGMNSIITGNVRIGPNVFINAGSLVTSDIPPNSVAGGVPAKVIGSFDKYVQLRIMKDRADTSEFKRNGAESIDNETVEMVWKKFDSKKNRKR